MEKYINERGLRILGALDVIAKAHNAKPAEVALAWLVAQEGVTAPIASATSVEQVDSLVRAARLELSAEEIRSLTVGDVHSLGNLRVNVSLRNLEPFFSAFGIKEGDPMWRPESERVHIW